MLSREDNELLTRIGPGTAMGALFRRHWLPFMLADELVADAPPKRLKLLGECLVAFRDSQGRAGLLGEHCPHRRASLALGRNEAGGLRCRVDAFFGGLKYFEIAQLEADWAIEAHGLRGVGIPPEHGARAVRERVAKHDDAAGQIPGARALLGRRPAWRAVAGGRGVDAAAAVKARNAARRSAKPLLTSSR